MLERYEKEVVNYPDSNIFSSFVMKGGRSTSIVSHKISRST